MEEKEPIESTSTPLPEDPSLETIPVHITININIPKDLGLTQEQKFALTQYMALFQLRCVGGFEKFEHGMGAFLCQALEDPSCPDVVKARVVLLDEKMVLSSQDYTKEEFIIKFGQQVYNNLRGWPKKNVGLIKERLVNFDVFEFPKIVEIHPEPHPRTSEQKSTSLLDF
jgi:hypothetical protein